MHAQFGILTLRNIAIQLRWSNDGQLGMPATDTIILAASQICSKLSPGLHYNNVDSKQNIASPCRCSFYYNINTHRFKNQTISSFYIQTSSCIQRSVQVLILSEHNHLLEFTTSKYSSMPNSQHVQRTANTNCSPPSTIANLNKNEIVNSFNHTIYFCLALLVNML